jgi:hypothetical protein
MKKLLVLLGLGAAVAWAYKQVNEARSYNSLWTDATTDDWEKQSSAPMDLR